LAVVCAIAWFTMARIAGKSDSVAALTVAFIMVDLPKDKKS
jgi:hypothetical protein